MVNEAAMHSLSKAKNLMRNRHLAIYNECNSINVLISPYACLLKYQEWAGLRQQSHSNWRVGVQKPEIKAPAGISVGTQVLFPFSPGNSQETI